MKELETIETSRLLLVHLDESWMGRFAQNPKDAAKELEEFLSLEHSERTEHPPSAYQYANSEIARFPKSAEWLCFWEIVQKEQKCRIGGILFKGPPDESGETEIGYGVDKDFQRRGYGLEAVQAGIQWAFSKGAGAVIAKVNPGNKASRGLLEKVGMEQYCFIGKMPCYRINRPLKAEQKGIKNGRCIL